MTAFQLFTGLFVVGFFIMILFFDHYPMICIAHCHNTTSFICLHYTIPVKPWFITKKFLDKKPNVSLNRNMVKDTLAELSEILVKTRDQDLTERFLRQLLTKNEVREVVSRWALVKMLSENVPQRQIAKKLGISLCKITRGSRELKKKNSAFMQILKNK